MSKKKPKKTKSVEKTAIKKAEKKSVNWIDLSEYKIPAVLMTIAAAVALALSFLQYGQTLPYEFVLDDQIVVSENNYVKKGFGGIGDLLLTESMVGYFGEQKDLIPGARYRPLSLISFAIEYGIVGNLNSRINHLVNVLLYALCGWLLFLSLAKIIPATKKWWFSVPFLAFVLWMSHPVHSEVVANIKGRDEIMSLIFSLLCLLLTFWIYKKEKLSILGLVLLAFSFFLGLLSKENVITLLAIIPATLYFFRAPQPKKMTAIFATLIISFIGYLALRYAAVGYFFTGDEVTDIMNNPFVGMGFMERMATVFYVLLKYIGLSFVPYPLTHDYYPFQIPRVGWFNIIVIISLLFHFALAIYAAINFKKRKTWAYIIFFYIASLSIYSNIVINVGTTMNERFLFVPTIATSLAVILGLKFLQERFKLNQWIPLGGLILIVVTYLGISFSRTQVWKNPLSLNTAAVQVSTNSARANTFMATAMFNKAKEMSRSPEKTQLLQDAYVYTDKAFDLLPTYYNAGLMKVGIAGELYKIDNNLANLLKSFKEVAIFRPDINFIHEYIDYISDRHNDDQAMYNFFYQTGYEELVINRKNYDWGLKFLNYGLGLQPNNAEINWAISKAYQYSGNQQSANVFLSKALQIDPSYQNR